MKEKVDLKYAEGRTTMMSDGELKAMIKEIDPARYEALKSKLKSRKTEE